jgi:hypothetical protein
MQKMEQFEIDAHRSEITADMRKLYEKYRAVFGWDIPEVDQKAADELILSAMHTAVDKIVAQ